MRGTGRIKLACRCLCVIERALRKLCKADQALVLGVYRAKALKAWGIACASFGMKIPINTVNEIGLGECE